MTYENAGKDSNSNTQLIVLDHLLELMKTQPDTIVDIIKSRNLQIKMLKAEIQHRNVVYKEMEQRSDSLVIEKNILKQDNEKLVQEIEKLSQHNLKLKNYIKTILEDIKQLNESNTKLNNAIKMPWWERIYNYSESLPTTVKSIIQFVFHPQLIKYVGYLCILIIILASFIGWSPIISIIMTLIQAIFGG
jgi:chromosome segregation ATPase